MIVGYIFKTDKHYIRCTLMKNNRWVGYDKIDEKITLNNNIIR